MEISIDKDAHVTASNKKIAWFIVVYKLQPFNRHEWGGVKDAG